MTRIAHILVAIPARDEAATIAACLESVGAAAASVHGIHRVHCVVAADACSDATAAIARAHGADVVETARGHAGAARSAAIQAGLDRIAADPARIWIANTDADSRVDPFWLTVHAGAAARADLLLGSIRPDPALTSPPLLARWLHHNPPAEHHGYIHGANLGFRADAYLDVGGFSDCATNEDVLLVESFRAHGRSIVSTDRAPVITSGRSVGRAPNGFADYLARLSVVTASDAPHPVVRDDEARRLQAGRLG